MVDTLIANASVDEQVSIAPPKNVTLTCNCILLEQPAEDRAFHALHQPTERSGIFLVGCARVPQPLSPTKLDKANRTF